jgi:26S proteasome regulatory subunit N3
MGKEVEMKDVEDGTSKTLANGSVESKEPEEEEVPPPTVEEQLKANVALLEKAVRSKDTRILHGKLQRQTALVRKLLTPANLSAFVAETLPTALPARGSILSILSKVWKPGAPSSSGIKDGN